ncbi:hypothetical protein, partial [Synechococcus sp. CCY 0621]|uniref:hypothetical protein n=1 Tax=Synechococcus sp. CCY 0621 TaxID=2815603 RepID=UPI001C23470F
DQFTAVQGSLFFRDQANNRLITIDASTGDPVVVPGVGFVSELTAIGNELFFAGFASPSSNGRELWRLSAGSTTATEVEIASGSGSSNPSQFTSVGGTLFFTATTSGVGVELWKLDGSGNPVLVKDINAGSGSSSP